MVRQRWLTVVLYMKYEILCDLSLFVFLSLSSSDEVHNSSIDVTRQVGPANENPVGKYMSLLTHKGY